MVRAGRRARSILTGAACVTALFAAALTAHAALPAGWASTPLGQQGYLDVTLYTGVDKTGTSDSYAGIQTAIDDASTNSLALYFPSGTYLVSNTLRCYEFGFSSRKFIILGSKVGARPVIKLTANASGFGSQTRVKPMLAIRTFITSTGAAVPSAATIAAHNAFDEFTGWEESCASTMRGQLRNLDFDCNGNAGAVGVSFPAHQNTAMMDIKVTATGAYAGFIGVPGCGGGSGNLEVVGGVYGIKIGPLNTEAPGSTAGGGGLGAAAIGLYGVKLTNQTGSALSIRGSWTAVVVGFDISRNVTGSAFITSDSSTTADGSCTLIDGKVTVTSGSLAIDNSVGKNLYLRNVYFSGTDNLVKSGADTLTLAGSGWKLLSEYTKRDVSPESGIAGVTGQKWTGWKATSYTLINGTLNSTATTPVFTPPSTVSAPPATLVSNHIPVVPTFEDIASGSRTNIYFGDAKNIKDYGAVPDDGADDTTAINNAIAAANAAGHGRVFVPKGDYEISSTITLGANTKLFGIGSPLSVVKTHSSWAPTTGNPIMVDTVDNATATAFLGFVMLSCRADGSGNIYNRFNYVRWRTGRSSVIAHLVVGHNAWTTENAAVGRQQITVTGNGGGRIYFFTGMMLGYGHLDSRALLVTNTTGQPLGIYSLNTEALKYNQNYTGPQLAQAANTEFNNADNVRLYTSKREGNSPTLLIQGGCQNVAFYGFDMRRGYFDSTTPSVQILGGANNNLLAANLIPESFNPGIEGQPIFREVFGAATTTVYHPTDTATTPDGAIVLFKRGTIDDSLMDFGTGGGGSAPAAPSGLTATAASSSQINLAWTDNSTDETGFEVDRALNSAFSSGLTTSTTGANVTAFNSTGLSASTTYYYRVRATNASGDSANSNTANATTLAGGGPAPVLRWQLDEAIGTTTADSAGTHTGTLVGSPTRVAGKFGNGINFTGTQYVSTPNVANLQITSQITLATWIKLNSATAGYKVVLSKKDGAYNGNGYELWVDPGTGGIRVRGGTGISTTGTGTFGTTWHHVAAVINGTAATIYFDGAVAGSGTVGAPTASTAELRIGMASYGGSGLNAALDGVRIYNTALTAAQVGALLSDD